jgi:hypothetical protein
MKSVVFTLKSNEKTLKVWISHFKEKKFCWIFFHTHECEFDTHECDFHTHACDFHTRACDFHTRACDFHTRACDFHTRACDLDKNFNFEKFNQI